MRPKERLIEDARSLLSLLNVDAGFERRRNRLAVSGYPLVDNPHELDLVMQAIRKAVYPSRAGGIH